MNIERRKRDSVNLGIFFGVALQLILTIYGYGKLVQRVEDLLYRVQQIELRLDTMNHGK